MGLLDGLKAEHRELLTHGREMQTCPPGTVIYRGGDPATSVYSIASGEVSVRAAGKDGAEVELGPYGTGELFGLAALFPGGQTRLAEASTPKGATLVEFRNDGLAKLKQHFGAEPAAIFMRNVLGAACGQLLRMLAKTGASARFSTNRHPDYPLDPSEWTTTIEEALPSGFLGGLFTKTKYPAGAEIRAKGAAPDGFFFLKQGTALVAGEDVPAPAVVGHLSFFAQVPQPAVITAATDCEAIPFDAKSLDKFLKKNPEEAHAVMNALLMLSAYQFLEVEYQR